MRVERRKKPDAGAIARHAGLALVAVLAGAARPAAADILSIASDGRVSARTGQGPVRWIDPDGATVPIATPPADATVLTLLGPATAPSRYADALRAAAAANGVSADLLAALVWQESRWRAGARSSAGAVGLAQLMPGTAAVLHVDPRDPIANLYGAAAYLRQQIDRFDGDIERALAAYNAGPGRVLRAGGVPAIHETRGYVAAIMDRLSAATSQGN